MKHKILIALALLLSVPVFSQTSQEILEKNKRVVAKLKKKHSLCDVDVFVAWDSTWYFRLVKAENGDTLFGAADEKGRVVVPVQCKELFYYPALDAGVSNFAYKDDGIDEFERPFFTLEEQGLYIDERTHRVKKTGKPISTNPNDISERNFPYYHKAASAVFLAKTDSARYGVYGMDGEVIRRFDTSGVSYFTGYFMTRGFPNPNSHYNISEFNAQPSSDSTGVLIISSTKYIEYPISLYTQSGDTVLSDLNSLQFRRDGWVVYSKKEGDVELKGAIRFDDSRTVPCRYFDVYTYGDEVEVLRYPVAEYTLYVTWMNETSLFRDCGEELFAKGMYADAVEYYSGAGAYAPHAKIYIAQASLLMAEKTLGVATYDLKRKCDDETLKNKYEQVSLDACREALKLVEASLHAFEECSMPNKKNMDYECSRVETMRANLQRLIEMKSQVD